MGGRGERVRVGRKEVFFFAFRDVPRFLRIEHRGNGPDGFFRESDEDGRRYGKVAGGDLLRRGRSFPFISPERKGSGIPPQSSIGAKLSSECSWRGHWKEQIERDRVKSSNTFLFIVIVIF